MKFKILLENCEVNSVSLGDQGYGFDSHFPRQYGEIAQLVERVFIDLRIISN